MMNPIAHILVVFEGSKAGKRALRDAAALGEEHRAEISVVTIIGYDPRTIGCCLRSGYWNRVLDEVALDELALARDILGERDPAPRFEIVPDRGTDTVLRIVTRLGCDLVLMPTGRWRGARSVRRLRRAAGVDVLGVRAG